MKRLFLKLNNLTMESELLRKRGFWTILGVLKNAETAPYILKSSYYEDMRCISAASAYGWRLCALFIICPRK